MSNCLTCNKKIVELLNEIKLLIGTIQDGINNQTIFGKMSVIEQFNFPQDYFLTNEGQNPILLQTDGIVWGNFPVPTQIIAENTINQKFTYFFLCVASISEIGCYELAVYETRNAVNTHLYTIPLTKSDNHSQEGRILTKSKIFDANTGISMALRSNINKVCSLNIKITGIPVI